RAGPPRRQRPAERRQARPRIGEAPACPRGDGGDGGKSARRSPARIASQPRSRSVRFRERHGRLLPLGGAQRTRSPSRTEERMGAEPERRAGEGGPTGPRIPSPQEEFEAPQPSRGPAGGSTWRDTGGMPNGQPP